MAPNQVLQRTNSCGYWQAKGRTAAIAKPLSSLPSPQGHCTTITGTAFLRGDVLAFPSLSRQGRVLTSPLHCGSSAGLALVQALQSPCRAVLVLINGKLAFLNKLLFLHKGRASQQKRKKMNKSYTCRAYVVLSQHPLGVWINTIMFRIFF